MSDDGEIPNLNAKPGDVLTSDGWKKPLEQAFIKNYEKQLSRKIKVDKLLVSNKILIMKIGQDRIDILEKKAHDAKIQPGVEYGKIQTAIKELQIFLDLIREVKI